MPVGFLDHTDGGSAFALVAPALAVAYGADLVEKHFTLDRSEKGYDYQSSLNPEDFYRMVELLRQAERAAGDGPAAESEGAKRYHRVMARSIVAGKLISARRGADRGDARLQAHRRALRAGLPAARGATASSAAAPRRPIQADETIREDMLRVSARVVDRGLRAHGVVALPGQGPGRPGRAAAARGAARAHGAPCAAWTGWPSPPPRGADNDPLAALAARAGRRRSSAATRTTSCAATSTARGMLDADHVVRVTGDNPLTDVETTEALVARHLAEGADYTYVPGDALLMGILSEVDLHRRARAALVGARRGAPPLGADDALHQGAPGRSSASRRASWPPGSTAREYRLTVDEPEDVRARCRRSSRASPAPGTWSPRGRRSRSSTPSRTLAAHQRPPRATRPPTCARWRSTPAIGRTVRAGTGERMKSTFPIAGRTVGKGAALLRDRGGRGQPQLRRAARLQAGRDRGRRRARTPSSSRATPRAKISTRVAPRYWVEPADPERHAVGHLRQARQALRPRLQVAARPRAARGHHRVLDALRRRGGGLPRLARRARVQDRLRRPHLPRPHRARGAGGQADDPLHGHVVARRGGGGARGLPRRRATTRSCSCTARSSTRARRRASTCA